MGIANDFTVPEDGGDSYYTGKIDLVDHMHWRNSTRSPKPCVKQD